MSTGRSDISSLEEYISSMMPGSANDKKDSRLNRPFDAPTYDKTRPPFGALAVGLGPESLNVIDLTSFNEETIIRAKEFFNELLSDLDGIELPEAHQDAIRSGYIFNAYNRHVIGPALQSATPEKMAVIKQQSEILRLISDNLSKSPEEILKKVKESNQKKLDTICLSAITRGLGEKKEVSETFDASDNVVRLNLGVTLGNIEKVNLLRARMNDYLYIGEEMRSKAFGATKPGKESSASKFPAMNMALSEAWARCANLIQREINANVNQVGLYTAMQSEYTRTAAEEKFAPVADFVHDILSIQVNYEARWAGLKARFTNKEKESYITKYNVIHEINKKITDLLAEYPQSDIKAIREKMKGFISEKRNELKHHPDKNVNKSELLSHLDRTVSKIDMVLSRGEKREEISPKKQDQKQEQKHDQKQKQDRVFAGAAPAAPSVAPNQKKANG